MSSYPLIRVKVCCTRWLYLIIGVGSTIWFLIRVIPKPSRASYPCMRVAAPIASSFVISLLGLATTVFVFKKAKQRLRESRYILAVVFILAGLAIGLWTMVITDKSIYADYTSEPHPANSPIGEAKGIFPGRVVWIHNPDATNGNCTNRYEDGWFLDKNNNQDVIDQMVSEAIQLLTGKTTDREAWDAIFKYFNENHNKSRLTDKIKRKLKIHNFRMMRNRYKMSSYPLIRDKGSTGYSAGEKILIKINATSSYSGNIHLNDFSIVNNKKYGIAETSPHVVLSVLRQLVNVVGVNETDIYVGDPMRHIYKHCYELWHSEFPDVNYLDHDYGASKGRVKVVQSDNPLIFYSDRGTVLRTDSKGGDPVTEDYLYTVFQDADYVINIPALKAHALAGITLFAKNHFGSHCRDRAKHLHNGLVEGRFGMGLYRVLVDIMGHELLGGKNLFYLLDGLWAGSEATDPPTKWSSVPFNNDWTSSIFASQDPVAIESVAYDFLKAEYTKDNKYCSYPQMDGVDDYLHQAADSTNWPGDIRYDPENDGTVLPSLGVHEHWNNPSDKQYSRNLGTGNGIELIYSEKMTSVELSTFNGPKAFALHQNYPNPFNPRSTISFDLVSSGNTSLLIYNATGELVRTLLNNDFRSRGAYSVMVDMSDFPSGVYFSVLKQGAVQLISKMMLLK